MANLDRVWCSRRISHRSPPPYLGNPPTHLGAAQREAQTDLDRPNLQRPAGSRPHHRHCLGDSAEQDGLEKGLPRRHAPFGSKRT
ncbi:Hypp3483 [Branchiostoma lanceolatum]|uniref:Hypp3483 protein n=1 Tax=Branchiostoma lanceolatum TaxID=7740 RepID=A0A8J9ZZV8_BRALA|nr:Hypp3483 [Branchiostoma lanceolatum]